MNRAWESGATPGQNAAGKRRWTALAALLASGLMLAPAASQAIPLRLALAQEESTGAANQAGNQVIAQGISRLPKGDVAWTVRRFEVPGEAGTAVESFPLGFALADGAEVALLDEGGDVLSLLDDGEAVFLPSGKAGALASWQDDVAAGLFEVALVSGEDATAGTTAGTVVGGPFAPPDGRAFEIELARETVSPGEEAAIPASRSGAPVLFLLTRGTMQLTPPGGQPVELAAGQYALLASEVTALGAGTEAATFVVAAIGESTGTREAAADGTPRAGRDRERNRDRASRGGGGGGGQAAGADRAARRAARQAARQAGAQQGGGGQTSRPSREERRANRQQGGGGGGQGQTQQPGAQTPPAGGTPVAGTPPPTDQEQGVTPEPTVPIDGTPTPVLTPTAEATPPVDDTVVQDDTAVEDDDSEVIQDDTEVIQDDTDVVQDDTSDDSEVVQDDTPAEGEVTEPGQEQQQESAPGEEGVAGESVAPTTAPETQSEQTLPVEEVPAEVVPAEDVPVEQAPVEEVPVEVVPAEEVPVEQAPPVEEAPPADPAAEGTAP